MHLFSKQLCLSESTFLWAVSPRKSSSMYLLSICWISGMMPAISESKKQRVLFIYLFIFYIILRNIGENLKEKETPDIQL